MAFQNLKIPVEVKLFWLGKIWGEYPSSHSTQLSPIVRFIKTIAMHILPGISHVLHIRAIRLEYLYLYRAIVQHTLSASYTYAVTIHTLLFLRKVARASRCRLQNFRSKISPSRVMFRHDAFVWPR